MASLSGGRGPGVGDSGPLECSGDSPQEQHLCCGGISAPQARRGRLVSSSDSSDYSERDQIRKRAAEANTAISKGAETKLCSICTAL